MNRKVLIGVIAAVLLAVGIGTYLYLTSEDANTSLNLIEKKWVDNNKKQVVDISVFNDIPVLNYHGEGIIFEFLDSLEENTGLSFNKVSYNIGSEVKTNYAFKQVSTLSDKDILIYQDNYVLVTLDGKVYNDPSEIKNITIGVLNSDLDKVNSYLNGASVSYKPYDNVTSMMEILESGSTLDSLNAIVVPKLQYLEAVLSYENFTLGYNIIEYKTNYVLTLSSDDKYNTLNSILTKYYKKWSSNNFENDFDKYLVSNYFSFTGEESQNVAKFHSKRYIYGFVNNKPFDVLSDGDLVGINNSIISDFSKKSGVVVEYKEYKSLEDLINAFNANEIDFYLGTNGTVEYKMDTYNTVSPFEEKVAIMTNTKKNVVVNSVNSLQDYTVSVIKGSKIAEFLVGNGIKVKEYNNMKSLMKNDKADVIAIDSYNYQYYMKKGLENYTTGLITPLNQEYTYVVRNISDNTQFAKFFSFYLSFIGTKQLINIGLADTLNVSITLLVIKNIFIVIGVILLIAAVIYLIKKFDPKNRKKHNNLSKGDKLRYIDMLTSLKNRNYLNDNIEVWDESEVYPQTIIVIDLNDIAYINDNYGHAEGDLVIKEAANILIKNQLSNSEIIRTNGNEFLIYLVSYEEKQVVSYIKKLNKEFKELAHGFGAAMGYSVINDAIKTIDDAINEATIDMRNNKEDIDN